MPAGEQRDDHPVEQSVLPDDDALQLVEHRLETGAGRLLGRGDDGGILHLVPFGVS